MLCHIIEPCSEQGSVAEKSAPVPAEEDQYFERVISFRHWGGTQGDDNNDTCEGVSGVLYLPYVNTRAFCPKMGKCVVLRVKNIAMRCDSSALALPLRNVPQFGINHHWKKH